LDLLATPAPFQYLDSQLIDGIALTGKVVADGPVGLWRAQRTTADLGLNLRFSCCCVSFRVTTKFFDFVSDEFVFGDFVLEKADGDAGFCLNTTGSEQVAIGKFVVVAAKIVHLYESLLNQRLKAVVSLTQADTHRLGHFPLLNSVVGFDELDQFVVKGVGKNGLQAFGSWVERHFSALIGRWQARCGNHVGS
jgi:hypothetical protein